jgi:hypothetical protein
MPDRIITLTDSVCADVAEERLRQIDKFAMRDDDSLLPFDWHVMIADYSAWARRCMLTGHREEARKRYVQVAALAVAAVEAIDRNGN